MEKAILKTIIYANIFNYPLKAWEIQKWLIGETASLRKVEESLRRKNLETKVRSHEGYYFLKGKSDLIKLRRQNKACSERYLKQANNIAGLFKIIPWVKLVGISGSLAMDNASEKDDIDFFIITDVNRLWTSRLLLLLILEILGKRRTRNDSKVNGKGCINLLLDTSTLEQKDKNIFIAHEVLQMRVLWEREGVYQKYLENNNWVFKHLPNWTSTVDLANSSTKVKEKSPQLQLFNFLELLFKWFQLRYMGSPTGQERLLKGAVYFHPQDISTKVLTEYQKKIKRLI